MLHLVLQGTHIIGYGIHAKGVQTAVEHVCLYANLIERLAEGTHGIIGILASQQVHLLKGTAVGLYTGKASHLDYHRSMRSN